MADDRALLGVHHLGFDGALTESEIEHRTKQMLARCLNMGNVIAFVGSGVSTAYGYPDWSTFTQSIIGYTLERARDGGIAPTEDEIKVLDAAQDYATAAEPSAAAADANLLMLDLCDELFARRGKKDHDSFRIFVESLVTSGRAADAKRPKIDPLRDIIERLEIRRFLTTNYDTEIEKAFAEVLGCRDGDSDTHGRQESEPLSHAAHSILPIARSLALQSENAEDLVRLAVAAPGFERGVFHIHGRVRAQNERRSTSAPPELVITERDYQRVYLQELEPHQRAYRDALRIALTGNPILFLGLGMAEADLLRPLRQFASERTRGGYERPLFALMPRPCDPNEQVQKRRSLYTRFGVKVIYYPNPDPTSHRPPPGEIQTEAFCQAIEAMADFWRDWWPSWRLKPPARKPSFYRDNNCMIRHRVLGDRPPTHPRLKDIVNHVKRPERPPSVVVVLGRPGTGKGTIGQWLVQSKKARAGHIGRFFATAHFTNDLLSLFEAAADYFFGLAPAGDDPRLDPLERLIKALKSDRHLFVLGGVDRLLIPQLMPASEALPTEYARVMAWPAGRPMTFEVERLFQLLRQSLEDGSIKSDVVLTSSLRPTELLGPESPVIPFCLDDSRDDKTIKQLVATGATDSEDLFFALRGHRYALSIIASALRRENKEAKKALTAWFLARLGAMDVDSRPAKTVQLVLDCLRRTGGLDSKVWPGLLQRVALFSTPVSSDAIRRCYRMPPKHLERTIGALTKANLLIGVDRAGGEAENAPQRVTAHTLVRNHVLKELGDLPSAPGEALRFDLTGWSTDVPETLAGQGDSHNLTAQCVDALLASLEADLKKDNIDTPIAREAIRAAFGLIRARWTATAIPRLHTLPPEGSLGLPLPHYDAYQRRLAGLMNMVRRTASAKEMMRWTDAPLGERDKFENSQGHLYADEFAWLHNEMATTAFCQGYLADAEALLRTTQLVNVFAERGTHGHRWCEVEIGLGLVQMERGHLIRARNHVENALRRAQALRTAGLEARARGHLALILHLQGHYEAALEHYASAIACMTERGELRALSIFLKHRADLFRKLEKFDKAHEDVQRSAAAAQSGRLPDRLQYARMSEANLLRAANEPVRIEYLTPALEFARRVGIPKLECELQNVQGRIALDHGEFELAERLGTSSMSIASVLGLRLQMTSCLGLAGQIADKRGNRKAGESLLRSSLDLAQHQRNQLQIESAERNLMKRN